MDHWGRQPLRVAPGGRFLAEDEQPFFWLADTGWLMFKRLTREEAADYLDDRSAKGFNVVQVMVVHAMPGDNAYGHKPFVDDDPGQPALAERSADGRPGDYWQHVDDIVTLAADRGIYLAMVPVWGSVVKAGYVDPAGAKAYGRFLGERYGHRPNVVWLNGGDIEGDANAEVWHALGSAIKSADERRLMTFHPFGRRQSSEWFHDAPWLDFNMFQSGHRTYDQRREQDPESTWKGEDNWRYVVDDYAREPAKPTVDGEPSYEDIPYGLEPGQPRWTAADCRRYAYWSVFSGAFGHTYGHNAVMQMHEDRHAPGAYAVRQTWREAIAAPGAEQLRHLKDLMLSRPYWDRVPDPSVVVDGEGERYARVLATRGRDYAFAYTYTGRPFSMRMDAISGAEKVAWWFRPSDGTVRELGSIPGSGVQRWDPPGDVAGGNDWVLVLDDATKKFPPPGSAS